MNFKLEDWGLIDYQIAWDIPSGDLLLSYGVVQKFTDQAISSDSYIDFLQPLERWCLADRKAACQNLMTINHDQ